ncbi:large conductance mechanosensitive channel protein MscL [Paracoccus onubensis]|uniref:Large-conductance mechanosensitive channel n=1 Tax=Paracoccus onubensis TaxID=1675788 RepID=A0A418SLX3_9RHOB|nr:large conductance mechanosensitive channel protein MscL [Paracoccus onubensis]RJE81966.1 large conductance mechanosensitive channel protein MscL [Paracoccus onubensis]
MIKEFKEFIAQGNVMDLAVGIIIGAAFTAIVTSLVDDLINPIIGLLTGGVDFTNKYFVLSGEVADGLSLAAAREAGAAVFAYGSFVMAVINFLIVAWVVFLLVKGVNRVRDTVVKKKEVVEEAAGPTQEELLAQIRDLLAARG